ncbi:CheR family methyltransferase [Sorangium sp. So ce1389]|uniref:CheR family methyltransferase n=1 Tax=Sorangium sp. So ce1389 TaxID=3133336 RepID=UPI003F6128C3
MSDETGISALLCAAAGASGLVPREDWEDQATRALCAIAEQRGAAVSALLHDRQGWPSLISELLEHLTVGETYFFRHASHFDVLLEALSARLADPLATACVLSAGCASGEEPYSVAIAIHARLGARALARVRIRAADISAASIRKARAGVYSAWAFRDAPDWLEPRYFVRGGASAGRRLVDVIRQAVTFEVGHVVNHAAGLPSGSVDAVLFRNLAIYLAPQVIAAAYAEFHRVLGPQGLLFVAPADPRPDGARFIEAGHETTSIYRPRAAGEPHGEPAPPSRRARLAARLRRDARLLRKGPPPAAAKRPAVRAAAPAARAAAPAARAAAPAARAAAPPPDQRAAEARAMSLADRGDVAAALSAAAALIEQPGTAPAGYLLRAQVSVAGDRAGAAVEDLRRALFLRPEHLLARYWYVVALRGDGQLAQAIQQARVLEELLTKSAAEARLEDGETTARELLDALRLLRGGFT